MGCPGFLGVPKGSGGDSWGFLKVSRRFYIRKHSQNLSKFDPNQPRKSGQIHGNPSKSMEIMPVVLVLQCLQRDIAAIRWAAESSDVALEALKQVLDFANPKRLRLTLQIIGGRPSPELAGDHPDNWQQNRYKSNDLCGNPCGMDCWRDDHSVASPTGLRRHRRNFQFPRQPPTPVYEAAQPHTHTSTHPPTHPHTHTHTHTHTTHTHAHTHTHTTHTHPHTRMHTHTRPPTHEASGGSKAAGEDGEEGRECRVGRIGWCVGVTFVAHLSSQK
jgi:hypothetical protein